MCAFLFEATCAFGKMRILLFPFRYFIIKSIVVNLGCFLFLFFATSPTYILTNMRVIYALKNLTKLLNIGDQINDFLPTMLLYTLATLLPILVAYSDWLLGHWRRSAENLWIMRKVKEAICRENFAHHAVEDETTGDIS